MVESFGNASRLSVNLNATKVKNSTNISGFNNNDLRPTEAQLRWAQFYHKARARSLKERIIRLYQTPQNVTEVDGAFSDDGVSTCSESSYGKNFKIKLKPRISRGRRALLKVSQRAFEKRRDRIRERGFQLHGENESDSKENLSKEISNRSVLHTRPRPNARFEAAFAMIQNLNSSQKIPIATPSKRWKRPQCSPSSDESPVTNFQDWKLGLARRKRNSYNYRFSRNPNIPFDRRASWMVHLPQRETSESSRKYKYKHPVDSNGKFLEPLSIYDEQNLLSPDVLKFNGLVAQFQAHDCVSKQDISRCNFPERYHKEKHTSSLAGTIRSFRDYNTTPKNSSLQPSEQEERHEMDLIQGNAPFTQVFDQLANDKRESWKIGNSGQGRVSEQYEQFLLSQKSRGSESNSTGIIRNVESNLFETKMERNDSNTLEYARYTHKACTNSSQGKYVVGTLRISEATSVGTQGTLDSDFFEKVRRMNGTTHDDSPQVNYLISRSQELAAIPETGGSLRHKKNQDPDSKEFNSCRRSEIDSQRSDTEQSFRNQSRFSKDKNQSKASKHSTLARTEVSDNSSSFSFISKDRLTPRSQSRGKGSLLDMLSPSSDITADHSGRAMERQLETTSSSFRRGVNIVADGIFSIITGKSSSLDDGSEIRAVAALRENQKERQSSEERSTSTSSFQVFPESIRRIISSGSNTHRQEEIETEEYHTFEIKSLQQQLPSLASSNPSNSSSDPATPERSLRPGLGYKPLTLDYNDPTRNSFLEDSLALDDDEIDQAIIDTDGTTSEASDVFTGPVKAATLMMSPTILTKRHQQAIKAIERRNWDQIAYLLSANPWLAEMMEVTTSQYLLHKLAFYGASNFLWSDENDAIDLISAAPEDLNHDLVEMFTSAVHKFDQDGNLPIHMAASSGNIEMAILLGEYFSSGASVRNNDGMLPLHFAIQACINPLANASGEMVYGADFVGVVLEQFPGGIAVADNEGNLPLHVAAAVLEGEVGVDILYMLLDEAERQATSQEGLRLVGKVHSSGDDESFDDTTTYSESLTGECDDDTIQCTMVKNKLGRNALSVAVEAGSGWQVIEAIARGPGGVNAALMQDSNQCNVLHLLLSEDYGDPQAALSILRIAPATVKVRNSDRMLPIEVACRSDMPEEVILAIVLVDTPIDLSQRDVVKLKPGFGGSWWFLTCECDDIFSELVEEVTSICNYEQLRELCSMRGGLDGNRTVISSATPVCKKILDEALELGITTARATKILFTH
jgi:hypothetical protein